MSAREELASMISGVSPEAQLADADCIIDAGYRKAVRATEFGTIFNRAAVFLVPPAESLEDFKERYEREFGWILTERDPILSRTFVRCDPEPSEPVLHAGVAQ